MSASLILSLLLAFNVSDTPEEKLAEFAYHVARLVPADQVVEILAVAYVETRFRPDAVSPAGCVCWLQQMCNRFGKPSCKEMIRTETCIREYLKDRAYWQRHCGEAWLDAYNAGWVKCWAGPWYKKHRGEARKQCKGRSCTSYSRKVRRTERRFYRWLEREGKKVDKDDKDQDQFQMEWIELDAKTSLMEIFRDEDGKLVAYMLIPWRIRYPAALGEREVDVLEIKALPCPYGGHQLVETFILDDPMGILAARCPVHGIVWYCFGPKDEEYV